jgi:hypothetical protein
MKNFIYYSKSDANKEPINKLSAVDLNDAQLIASHIKQMSLDSFLEIFIVEEIINTKTKYGNTNK